MSFTTIYSTFRLLYASFTIEVFPDEGNGQETRRKRLRTDDGAVARGAYAAYCAGLRAHDYGVQPEVIVNASGLASESLMSFVSPTGTPTPTTFLSIRHFVLKLSALILPC